MNVTLITNTEKPEKAIATAAKLCYSPGTGKELWESEGDIDLFIAKLRKMGHMSPFEHASFTFAVDGVSRALTHQLVRHRVASYSQQSQRYVVFGKQWNDPIHNFVIPDPILDMDDEVVDLYYDMLYQSFDNYEEMVDALMDRGMSEKEAAENARYLLPNAAKTNIIVTMNAREFMHFFEVRCCNRAQKEIRDLAWAMRNILKDKFPVIFKNTGPTCLTGKCKEGTMTCGQPYSGELF